MRKYRGIKKAAGETKGLNGYNGHTQIVYDTATDTVYSEYIPNVNEWYEHHDPYVVWFTTTVPMTMEEIKDQIKMEIADKKQYEAEMKIEDENQLRYAKEMEKYDYME